MIMYEYQCCKCNKIWNVGQHIMEDKLTEMYCPICDEIVPIKRLIGSSGFVLKGDGWGDSGYVKRENNESS